jgi:hypothetical protein
MTSKKLALIAGALMALGPVVAGHTSNGVTTITNAGSGSFGPFYLDCIGEMAEGTAQWDTRFHVFETKSGTTHIVENWSYRVLYTGTSGRQWYGEGVSPSTTNFRVDKGFTYQSTSSSVMRPLDGGAPAFVFRAVWKITVNANGEPTVSFSPDPDRAYVCLGKK